LPVDRTRDAIEGLALAVRASITRDGTDELLSTLNISTLRAYLPEQALDSDAHRAAIAAAVQDSSLAPLRSPSAGEPVFLAGSFGGFGSSPSHVPSVVAGAAAFEVAITRAMLQVEPLLAAIGEYLHQMRQIAASETILLRFLAGLTGFLLPEGIECHGPLGSMWAADPRMRQPGLVWTIWTVPNELPPPALFMTTIPYHVDIVRPGGRDP
jgi:hypothetical protein